MKIYKFVNNIGLLNTGPMIILYCMTCQNMLKVILHQFWVKKMFP